MKKVRFKIMTGKGPGFIEFEVANEATGQGRVIAASIPDQKAWVEFKRQTNGNPECHLRNGGLYAERAGEWVITLGQVMTSIENRVRGFSSDTPDFHLPKLRPGQCR